MKDFAIKTMGLPELELALCWAAREGWNPGLHDAEIFHKADPGGFFIGMLHDKPVAAVSAVRYGEEFGFIGLYIVDPEFRDRGHGGRLLLHATGHLAGCRSIGLDGVEQQQSNYARHGARYAHANIRFEGKGSGAPIRSDFVSAIHPLADVPLPEIIAYDRQCFPASRDTFLKAWISQSNAEAFGILRNGTLTGYAVRRRCITGHKIGPLFADGIGEAEALLAALRQGLGPEELFYLDVPEPNSEALELAAALRMNPVFQTARMYTGEDPDLPLEKIYGITSFELG